LEDKKEGPGRFFYHATNKVYEGEWVDDVAKCGTFKDVPSDVGGGGVDTMDNFSVPSLELEDPEVVVSEAVAKIRQERAQAHAGDQEVVFTPGELEQLRNEFRAADSQGSGVIKCSELGTVLRGLGMTPQDDEIQLLLEDLNADVDTEISFAEFVDIMALLSAH